MSAVRITTADGQAVTVASHSEAMSAWSARYLGHWWTAEPVQDIIGPMVSGDVDDTERHRLTDLVTGAAHQRIEYAGTQMLYTREQGMVTAVQPDQELAYRWDPGWKLLRIVGADETAVATATARLAREVLRAQLHADGWAILHASAVTDEDGATVLTLGDKGAGKTTTGFTLARAGWALLANDRVFARADEEGTVQVLPWPSAAAIGLGLLHALDLYDTVRERLASGEQMHPTQHPRVTDALLTGRREPLWKSDGKELKPQFFPDQLTTWLSLQLATQGHAAGILLPHITPDATPRLIEISRGVQDTDFFGEATEDRYPDVFGLLPPPADHTALRTALDGLPRQGLVMGHDTSANTTLLKDALARLGL
ncbi:hypothetical protein [Streptomyces sp. NPDC004285]